MKRLARDLHPHARFVQEAYATVRDGAPTSGPFGSLNLRALNLGILAEHEPLDPALSAELDLVLAAYKADAPED